MDLAAAVSAGLSEGRAAIAAGERVPAAVTKAVSDSYTIEMISVLWRDLDIFFMLYIFQYPYKIAKSQSIVYFIIH